MKKFFTKTFLILGASVLIIACSKEEDEPVVVPDPTLEVKWMQTNAINYTNALGTINVTNARLDSGKYYYEFKSAGVVKYYSPIDTNNGTYTLTNNQLKITKYNNSTGRTDTILYQTAIFSLDTLRLENRKVQYVGNDSIVTKVILRFKK